MKHWLWLISLGLVLGLSQIHELKATESADEILYEVYGAGTSECTQDADADTGEHNRLGPFTAGRRYLVYGHDGSGSGSAVECLWGDVTVNAAATNVEGEILFDGEKVLYRVDTGNTYVSCVPFSANQAYDVCPRD